MYGFKAHEYYIIVSTMLLRGRSLTTLTKSCPLLKTYPTYPRLPLAKEFLYSYNGKLLLTIPVPLTCLPTINYLPMYLVLST
jgi:hypothetical protein